MKFKINPNKSKELEELLILQGYEPLTMKDNLGIDFNSKQCGKIRVYKNGTILPQGSVEQTTAFNVFWEEHCKFLEESTQLNMPGLCYSYFVEIKQRGSIKKTIEEFAISNEITIKSSIDPNAQYQFSVIDKNRNKLSITQYKTTGKLVLRGKYSFLWEQISELISKQTGLVIHTMVANVVNNEAYAGAVAPQGDEIEIINVITSKDQESAEVWTKKRLRQCYDFLYENDRNRVESSEILLSTGAKLKDYFGCISGTIEALEGFTKKLLVEINAFSERELLSKTNKWDFSQVVEFKSREISNKVKDALSSDLQIRTKQESYVHALVASLSKYRNPYFHSSPPNGGNPIQTFDKARQIHDEIVSLMSKAFEILESEFKQ